MKLDDLFKDLSYGELSNLSMAVSGAGSIRAEDQPKILLYTQEALTRLYSRFILSEKLQVLTLDGDGPTYQLNRDVIKVQAVTDMQGNSVPLNDEQAAYSVFTPAPQVLKVPSRGNLMAYNVFYQADHPVLTKIDDDTVDDEDVIDDIDLTDVLIPALRSYIAGSVYVNMNGQDNAAIANNHFSKYESICVEVIEKDLVSTSSATTNTRFRRGGWV